MPAPMIDVWEKDPGIGVKSPVPQPDLGTLPHLQVQVQTAGAPPAYDPIETTAGFRYWVAAEALRRGIDFWEPAVPAPKRWPRPAVLPVVLEAWTTQLKSAYDRDTLSFSRAVVNGKTVYTGESPDTVCHELGHAILDAINYKLFNRGSDTEIEAFHEAFGDISAMLCALQRQSFRDAFIQTNGQLFDDTTLSRFSQQFGAAVHFSEPNDAFPNCLRNAFNTFHYQPPLSLQQHKPIAELSREAHSFSRIFSGAALEILQAMLAIHAHNANQPTEGELLDVSLHFRDIIAGAAKLAPDTEGYFAEVAQKMIEQSVLKNADYPEALRDVFVARLILSPASADAIVASLGAGNVNSQPQVATASLMAFSGTDFGIAEDILVDVAPPKLESSIARAGSKEGETLAASNTREGVWQYVSNLFERDQVDLRIRTGEEKLRETADARSQGIEVSKKTHWLERTENGIRLRRNLI